MERILRDAFINFDNVINNSFKKQGGGIMIGIKKTIISEQLSNNNVDIELLCIHVLLKIINIIA